jgi:hypothetical protein
MFPTSEKDISTVKAIVDEDARHIVIGNLFGLSASYVFSILHEKLKLREVYARLIPHLLTSDQKRIEKASALLTSFKDRNPKRLKEIVKGVGTWRYFLARQ